MKCYVLARCFDMNELEWTAPDIPGSGTIGFFISLNLGSIKQELVRIINSVSEGERYYEEKDGYYMFVRKLSNSYIALACDTELTAKQLDILCWNLLTEQVDPAEAVNDLDKYITFFNIAALQKQVDETTAIMKSNIEKMHIRGEVLEKLLANTEGLVLEAKIFRFESAQLNKCWPDWCSWPPKFPWSFW